jgi:hypothetical protein
LTREDLVVREDGKKRPIVFFQEYESVPVSLVILIETGSNMTSRAISTGRELAFSLIHELEPTDEILLASYDKDVYFLTGLTTDRTVLVNALWNIGLGGRPSKWARMAKLFASSSYTGHAVDLSLLEVTRSTSGNKIILVVSAGFASIGPATADHLEMAGARLIAVSMSNKLGDTFNLGGDQTSRKRVIERTGGVTFPGRDVLKRIDQVRDTIKRHYRLAYKPVESEKDLLKRNVEFRVRSCPECQVHAGRRTQSSDSLYR